MIADTESTPVANLQCIAVFLVEWILATNVLLVASIALDRCLATRLPRDHRTPTKGPKIVSAIGAAREQGWLNYAALVVALAIVARGTTGLLGFLGRLIEAESGFEYVSFIGYLVAWTLSIAAAWFSYGRFFRDGRALRAAISVLVVSILLGALARTHELGCQAHPSKHLYPGLLLTISCMLSLCWLNHKCLQRAGAGRAAIHLIAVAAGFLLAAPLVSYAKSQAVLDEHVGIWLRDTLLWATHAIVGVLLLAQFATSLSRPASDPAKKCVWFLAILAVAVSTSWISEESQLHTGRQKASDSYRFQLLVTQLSFVILALAAILIDNLPALARFSQSLSRLSVAHYFKDFYEGSNEPTAVFHTLQYVSWLLGVLYGLAQVRAVCAAT